ncbi:DinB family protein [Tunicatimonas pelagia]|uniref:DinB family protein n=1 Tax=Tunicatimonas pelagia TaxID=931531 RepID=UPI00266551F4|nr:DinB family protein [Tunicatimonas pelagia]WKN46084.1 DinB family protein [Tunicatimonas pelagia]
MDLSSSVQLRQQLVKHLEGGEAFVPLDTIVHNIPFDKLGMVPDGLPYSLWQQFYHLRYTQLDILEFCRNPTYASVKWPDNYWPSETKPEDWQQWNRIVNAYFSERSELAELTTNPKNNLMKPLSHGEGQMLLREVLLVIEHTAYHTGQILIILRLLGEYE